MTLEIVDRILCSFGEFLILDLCWGTLKQRIYKTYLMAGILYVLLHSIILYLILVVYNVMLNSDINTFLIMIFVNNSMKLKSTALKKFNEQGYFSQTHTDLRARF